MKLTLLLSVCALAVAFVAFIVLKPTEKLSAPSLGSINTEYRLCIEQTENEAVAECLDLLAKRIYGVYATKDIASELDTLTYKEKDHWCHELMHYMGWQAYAIEGEVAESFLNSSELCDSGMYHGVMEGYLRAEGLSGDIEELVRTVCTDSLASNPHISEGLLSLCYHGLGHGLMYVTASDLKRSLEYCDVLPTDSEQGSCYTGAFMEFTASKEIGPLENARNLTDFSYCEDLNVRHKKLCYLRQGLNNVSSANGDIELAAKMCLEVPEQYLDECFRGVGGNNPSPGKSHAQAGRDCLGALKTSSRAYEQCISGSLGFVFQLEWGDMEEAVLFCAEVQPDFANYCYREAGRQVVSWHKDKDAAAALCSAFSDPIAKKECELGVAVSE